MFCSPSVYREAPRQAVHSLGRVTTDQTRPIPFAFLAFFVPDHTM